MLKWRYRLSSLAFLGGRFRRWGWGIHRDCCALSSLSDERSTVSGSGVVAAAGTAGSVFVDVGDLVFVDVGDSDVAAVGDSDVAAEWVTVDIEEDSAAVIAAGLR